MRCLAFNDPKETQSLSATGYKYGEIVYYKVSDERARVVGIYPPYVFLRFRYDNGPSCRFLKDIRKLRDND